MKIFLSWSGESSHEIARSLKDWLPLVHQKIEPFMSSEDIEKGSRWAATIGSELEGTNFGILCLTQENVDAPWICFEAGALAKIVEHSKVAPILFGIQPSDLQGPLAQFQATKFDKADVARLVRTINASVPEEAREDGQLDKVVEYLWPELAKTIEPIIATGATKGKPKRDRGSGGVDKFGPILEEILLLVRQQSQIVSDPTSMLSPKYFRDTMEELILRSDRYGLHSSAVQDLSRWWIRFEREWQDLLPVFAVGEPSDRIERLKRTYSRLRDAMRYVMQRLEPDRPHKWRRGVPPRLVSTARADQASVGEIVPEPPTVEIEAPSDPSE